MPTLTGPAITSTLALGPVSQILPPQYRFAGDDWDDENAFVFTFYDVLPTFDPVTGAITSPGQVRNLTGCTFAGSLAYAPRSMAQYPAASGPASSPIPMAGTIAVQAGQGTLTLALALTGGFPRQDSSVWDAALAGDTSGALMILQARLTDSLGKVATKGIIPLYVF